jgi:hypothetical protein
MPSIGVGTKRLTVIGGTYFRLLPLGAIESLLASARWKGFVPMVYLHPYDIDANARPLAYPSGYWHARAGDWVRRRGRGTALAKLRALAGAYAFEGVSDTMRV